MKNFLLAFFIFLIYSVFGMWYHSCVIKELCNSGPSIENTESLVKETSDNNKIDKEQTPSKEKEAAYSFNYKEGDITFSFPNNLGLIPNEAKVIFPKGDKNFKESIFKFLNTNQKKELIIMGLLNSAEANIDPELGLKRAKYIKDILVKFGINSERITIKRKQADYNFDSSNAFKGGIHFDFIDISEEKRKTIDSGIANKTLYSGFGSKEFRADNTLKAYALELKNYLNKYPKKTASIVGHTDGVGDVIANDWYGMERAKNVKQYLVSQGIDESRLFASSKGELEPIESNGTLEGRRKNRRIEIKIN